MNPALQILQRHSCSLWNWASVLTICIEALTKVIEREKHREIMHLYKHKEEVKFYRK